MQQNSLIHFFFHIIVKPIWDNKIIKAYPCISAKMSEIYNEVKGIAMKLFSLSL